MQIKNNRTKSRNLALLLVAGVEEFELSGHSTSDITEMYHVKRNDDLLNEITNGIEI